MTNQVVNRQHFKSCECFGISKRKILLGVGSHMTVSEIKSFGPGRAQMGILIYISLGRYCISLRLCATTCVPRTLTESERERERWGRKKERKRKQVAPSHVRIKTGSKTWHNYSWFHPGVVVLVRSRRHFSKPSVRWLMNRESRWPAFLWSKTWNQKFNLLSLKSKLFMTSRGRRVLL